MRKKILIITDNLRDQVNGVVTTFNNLEKQAHKNGYDIEFIDPSCFPHVRCPGYPEVKLSWPWGIGQMIRDSGADHIHIATEGPIGVAGSNYCWRKGLRYNTSYHTKFPEFLNEIYGIPASWTYWYVRWFHKHSGRVLTTTESMVKELKANGFTWDIVPWTRGVDRQHIKAAVEHVVNTAPVVLYVGRVSVEKGLDDLCQLGDRYRVIVVGDGPDRIRLEKQYPRVEFVGYKKGTDLANYYVQADVFAFPSRVDTFGIVMIEAISLGTPVAAYPVTGPMDVIETGINGYMHNDLATAINLALQLNRDQVRASGDKWTWENCWKIFEDNLIGK
jgi:glycosyltransferase involved in cell wall biosynthesis